MRRMTAAELREIAAELGIDVAGAAPAEPYEGTERDIRERRARGLLRAEAKDEGLPGFVKTDYLDEEAFWAQVEGAKETARGLAERIKAGDLRHDPKGGECPSWCDLWPMCRVRRA